MRIIIKKNYNTDKGIITIEITENYSPAKGDFVFQGIESAPDGKYQLGFFRYITVKNGRIVFCFC
jgi:hypothetical protein